MNRSRGLGKKEPSEGKLITAQQNPTQQYGEVLEEDAKRM